MRAEALALLAVAFAVAPSLPRGAEAQTPPVFPVSVEAVYVDAFVTRHGRPVPGLTASDFELQDDGVLQSPELLGTDAPPLTSILAFDTSGSVAGDKIEALRSAGEAFLAGLRPRDRVGLLAFQEEIHWLVPPTADRGAVWAALGRLSAGGATALLDALYAAIVLPGTRTRSLVVLFSDGQDNMSWLDAGQVQQVAARSNALVFVVSIRPSADTAPPRSPLFGPTFAPRREDSEPEYLRELRDIAETTGGRLWWAESLGKLKSAFASIAAAMNQRYVLRYEPRGVAHGGWHHIELHLRGKKGDVQARPGYWGGPP